MSSKLSLAIVWLLAAFAVVGCSSDPGTPSPELKKAFGGGPPPADYMKQMSAAQKGGAAAAQKAMEAAKAAHPN
jgi:hypothetical protein